MSIGWDDWQFVRMAWEEGSFTAAAQALGVGQATVSRRVGQVEQQLGRMLFDRHRTGLVPTEAAHALRPYLEALAAAARGAERAVEGLEVEARGVVRVAMAPGMAVDHAAEVALRLRERHPQVTLEVLADVRSRDLELREADIALRTVPTERGDLLVRRLLTFRGGLYASPALLQRVDPDPDRVPLVQWAAELEDTPLARFLATLSGPVVFTTNDYLTLRSAVAAGLGASVLSEQEANALGLVEIPLAQPLPATVLYVVIHRAVRRVPRIEAVVSLLDEVVATRGRGSGALE